MRGIVEWHIVCLLVRTVTANPGKAAVAAHVQLPSRAAPFSSGGIAAGLVYRHRFEIPGTYRYVCGPHEDDEVVGTVIVTPGGD